MDGEVYRRFQETGQEKIRLEAALQGFFDNAEENTEHLEAYGKYLKKRIRPAMQKLIETEETEKIEKLESFQWFDRTGLDGFISFAAKQHKLSALVCLMQLKDKKYGYQDREFFL